MDHIQFEKKLMNMFLDDDDPVLFGLKTQYLNSIIESREFTGAGFYTNFKVKEEIEAVADKKTFEIDDIDASIGNVKSAIGFILYIKNGYIQMLEGYTLVLENWPEDYSDVILKYDGPYGSRDYEKHS